MTFLFISISSNHEHFYPRHSLVNDLLGTFSIYSTCIILRDGHREREKNTPEVKIFLATIASRKYNTFLSEKLKKKKSGKNWRSPIPVIIQNDLKSLETQVLALKQYFLKGYNIPLKHNGSSVAIHYL